MTPDLPALRLLAQAVPRASEWFTKSDAMAMILASRPCAAAHPDATFIAAASPDVVLAMISRIEELEDIVKDARKLVDSIDRAFDRLAAPPRAGEWDV